MNGPDSKLARCAIYTRKSTEYNLELAFNSLDAQRDACEAYIRSQAHEGWRLIPARYDDGAFSGACPSASARPTRSRYWLKFKNPAAPAVKREAEEDWGRGRWR